MPEGAGAGARRTRQRPRCCRWAKTGPHHWQRAIDPCSENWFQVTLLYWNEGPTSDDVFCSICGHTMGCHLRARRQHLDEDGTVCDEHGHSVSNRA